MKRIILLGSIIALLTMFSACKKEVSLNEPKSDLEAQAEAIKAAEDSAHKADEAKAAEAKADEAKAPAADDNKAPDMDNKEAPKNIALAVDICKMGDLPDETEVLNADIKNAFAGCKSGKTDSFGLKLGESYEFNLAISSLTIELNQFKKHDNLEDTIKELNSMIQYPPQNVKIEDAQELSKKLGTAVKKCTYTTGGNEDTMFHEDYYYTSGDHDFQLGMKMHEDELAGLKGKVLENLVVMP
ncbi:MAG: hypothetical protein J6A01_11020 [Proteobacteria bacterium]|nr:hypothetical protein [Pseudomonadota bacterium]